MSTEELLAHVLRLPRKERARLAEEVLSSLEEPNEDELQAAWAAELLQRSRDVAEGRVRTVDWQVARADILRELEERRAGRAPS